ncbi:MAG: hypothetical protein AAB277_04675, partial [Planctomycetota bacterium]
IEQCIGVCFMSECKFLYSHLWFRMFYPEFEYLNYYTPDTSELIIISINLYKIVDSALQSAYKLGCLWQRLLSSPLERGAGGVLRKTYTPLYPLFLEGNQKRLKFLYIKLEVTFTTAWQSCNQK